MNVQVLIDGIVRQTTVLIAELSTSAGVRMPLGRIADQVFFDLAREIEAQGVSRKVVADMFGLALRSYQKKMHRLAAGETDATRTLWQAILELLRTGAQTRARVLERFARDGEREVGAVLADLVGSGLVYASGSGATMVYGLTPEADLHRIAAEQDLDALANVAWLQVFRESDSTVASLVAKLGVEETVIQQVVDALCADGRVRLRTDGTLETSNLVIPVGATAGWEAAVLDHYRAVAVAIAAKAKAGGRTAPTDQIGGATHTFRLPPGHPHEAQVLGLLREVRAKVGAIWDEVAAHNARVTPAEDCRVVTFYFGQLITSPESIDERDETAGGEPQGTSTSESTHG